MAYLLLSHCIKLGPYFLIKGTVKAIADPKSSAARYHLSFDFNSGGILYYFILESIVF